MAMLEEVDEAQALEWHLTYNFFPPVDSTFIPVAEQAIELTNEGETDTLITMPNGKILRAIDIIEGLRLWEFLEEDEEPF